jgi:hypothetical protein
VQPSTGLSHLEQDLELQLQSSPLGFPSLDRRRRTLLEPILVDPTPSHEQSPKPSSVQEAPQTQQPTNSTKPDTSLSVSYSTAEQKPTTTLATPATSSTASSALTTKPAASGAEVSVPSGPTAKGVIVSTPLIPSTDKSNNTTKPTVANATVATKATQSADEKAEKPVCHSGPYSFIFPFMTLSFLRLITFC